jgi:hypothetical protein
MNIKYFFILIIVYAFLFRLLASAKIRDNKAKTESVSVVNGSSAVTDGIQTGEDAFIPLGENETNSGGVGARDDRYRF